MKLADISEKKVLPAETFDQSSAKLAKAVVQEPSPSGLWTVHVGGTKVNGSFTTLTSAFRHVAVNIPLFVERSYDDGLGRRLLSVTFKTSGKSIWTTVEILVDKIHPRHSSYWLTDHNWESWTENERKISRRLLEEAQQKTRKILEEARTKKNEPTVEEVLQEIIDELDERDTVAKLSDTPFFSRDDEYVESFEYNPSILVYLIFFGIPLLFLGFMTWFYFLR